MTKRKSASERHIIGAVFSFKDTNDFTGLVCEVSAVNSVGHIEIKSPPGPNLHTGAKYFSESFFIFVKMPIFVLPRNKPIR